MLLDNFREETRDVYKSLIDSFEDFQVIYYYLYVPTQCSSQNFSIELVWGGVGI